MVACFVQMIHQNLFATKKLIPFEMTQLKVLKEDNCALSENSLN